MAVITREMLQLAAQVGACAERRAAYCEGMDLTQVRLSDLAWMVGRVGKYAEAFTVYADIDVIVYGRMPVELCGFGYGYGDGSGSGYGYGYGTEEEL